MEKQKTTTIAIYKEDADFIQALCEKGVTYRMKLHEIIEFFRKEKLK